MADVIVQVQQKVEGTADVQKATVAASKLAQQEERLKKVGGAAFAKTSAAAKLQTTATAKLGGEVKKTTLSTEKLAGVFGDLKSGNVVGLTSKLGAGAGAAGLAGVAVAGIGVAAVAAAVGVFALGAKLAMVATEALSARKESEALLRVITKGDTSAVSKIATEFDRLGVPLDAGTKKLQELTAAGLRGGDALAGLRLGADLKIGSAGSEAVLGEIKALGSEYARLKEDATSTNAKIARDAQTKLMAWPDMYKAKLAGIAKQQGVTGTGADAAAAKMNTLAGAAYRIEKVKTGALESLGKTISPALDMAASKVATLFEGFAKSPIAQKIMTELGSSIVWVSTKIGDFANAIARDLPIYEPILSKMVTGFKVVGGIVVGVGAVVIGAIGAAAIVVGAAATAIGAAVDYIGSSWAGWKAGIVGTIDAVVSGVKAFPGYVAGAFTNAINAAVAFKDRFIQAGADLVNGVIDGVSGAAGRLFQAVGNIASGAVSKFKSVLGIASPSKLFAVQGGFIGAGAAQGIEASTPRVEGAAEKLADASVKPMVNARSLGSDRRAPGLPPMAFGEGGFSEPPEIPSVRPPQLITQSATPAPTNGGPFVFNLTINGVDANNADEVGSRVRREIEAMLSGFGYMSGTRS